MGCVIKYKGQSIPEEQFLQYLNKQIAINSLFNKNESLANAVYEAIGFKSFDTKGKDKGEYYVASYLAKVFIQRLTNTDNILGNVFDSSWGPISELNFKVQPKIVITEDNKKANPFYQYNNTIIIGMKQLVNLATADYGINQLENIVERVADEEQIHLIADFVTTKNDIEAIYKELSKQDIQKIKDIYNNQNLSKDNIVHEYLRMVVQNKIFGTTTEIEIKKITNPVLEVLRKIINTIIEFLARSDKKVLTTKTVNDIINFTKNNISQEVANKIQNKVFEGYTQEGSVQQIKEGVSELFESDKELADKVYEAAGFKPILDILNELNTNLENYLKNFGFNTEQLDDLKQTTGYSIIGATDFLEKTIFVQKENINKAYTREAAYVIFNLLGRKNILRKDLIASIHLIDNYENLKSQYINSKLSDYTIRELIAIDYLKDKLIEAHKESLPTTNKAVSKDVTAKNKLEYIILKIKQWWSNIIRNFFKSYKKGYIEDVFNQIANDVINNNTRLFNLSKKVSYKKMELTSIQKEINDNLVKLGAINSGSYSLNRQGNLTRENINDLDYFIPYQIKDDFIKDVIKKYPQAVFSEPYSGVMGNRSLTLSLKIDDAKIDFFLPTSQEESDKNKIIVIDGVKYHHWKNIFDAKIRIGAQKHLSDLAGFTPFNKEWSVYNVNWRNPLILKDDYLNIVGQRHYNFDFIQSKYNTKEYSSTEQVTQSDNIKTYWDKNLEQTALNYFKDNNIEFEKSNQYQDLLSYFNNKKDKATVAYYLTFSENFKKFYGNIDSRKGLTSFIINFVKGNYSKNSVLLDENNEPVIFYHGAGTMFDKFSKDYFLSGEGAMAYGAGFYSTNYKPTADNYRDTAKSAINTFNKLLQEKNQQLLDLISKLKIDINENTLIGFMMGSLDVKDSKSKTELLNLLGLTETKALYLALTNPLYWQKDISKENKDLIESHFGVKLKNINSGQIYRELEKTLKISDKELSARLYQIGIDGVINIAGGGQAVGGFSHKKGEKHVIFFEPVQAKAVNNSGLFSLNNENMYDPVEIKDNNQINKKSSSQITPQQKQEATFMFSEFLDVYLQNVLSTDGYYALEEMLVVNKIIERKCS